MKERQRLLDELQGAQEAQARALERFHRAETRLQKRTARVQRMAAELMLLRQQLGEPAAPAPLSVSMPAEMSSPAAEESYIEEQAGFESPTVEETLAIIDLEIEQPPAIEEQPVQEVPSSVAPRFIEGAQLAREARAAAEAAEQASRQAAERAAAAAARLEQVASARHLAQELLQMQVEAEHASVVAQEAERAAREAALLADESERLARASGAAAQQEEAHDQSLPAEAAHTGEIEEEEALLETNAATMVADVAAAAAAEAEAVAEASSARTREARQLAQEADRLLEEAVAAVNRGALSGPETESYLRAAELESTRAHALLADAEAAEEQALNTAMNAEAEAEVAEGMAFAATDRAVELLDEDEPATSSAIYSQVDDDEDAITLEMPSIQKDEA